LTSESSFANGLGLTEAFLVEPVINQVKMRGWY